MKEILIMAFGVGLCSIGIYCFANDIDFWIWWLICGILSVLSA